MKLKPNEYKQNYIRYILGCVEVDRDKKPITNETDKVNYIVSRFYDEYGFMIERVGKQKAIAEWLSGLNLNLPYYDDDMVNLAVEMGSIDPNPSKKLRERVIDKYWDFMANVIMLMEKKWKVEKVYYFDEVYFPTEEERAMYKQKYRGERQ
tara:strand:+ start:796 stop:1248 length:453 start_codon:yes stop_codon:yes gene_type:complete